MSFGRNPHVTKAEAAEQKARDAKDAIAREQAWRQAAHLWERAAERENDEKRKQLYLEKAEQAREQAETDEPSEPTEPSASAQPKSDKTMLN